MMENEYERVLAALTESQIALLVAEVQTGLKAANARGHDQDALLRLGLYERELKRHLESYTGNRTGDSTWGPPVPSDFGREWVAWYVRRHKK